MSQYEPNKQRRSEGRTRTSSAIRLPPKRSSSTSSTSDPTLLLQARSGAGRRHARDDQAVREQPDENACCTVIANEAPTFWEMHRHALEDKKPLNNVEVPRGGYVRGAVRRHHREGRLRLGRALLRAVRARDDRVQRRDLGAARVRHRVGEVSSSRSRASRPRSTSRSTSRKATRSRSKSRRSSKGRGRELGINVKINKLAATDYINSMEQHKAQAFTRIDGPGVIEAGLPPRLRHEVRDLLQPRATSAFRRPTSSLPKARQETDPARRQELWDEIASLWVEQSPRDPGVRGRVRDRAQQGRQELLLLPARMDFRTWRPVSPEVAETEQENLADGHADRRRRRRHVHRPDLLRRRVRRGARRQGADHARRARRRASSTRSRRARAAGAGRRGPSTSCTARPSASTRCSSARARSSACSRRAASATSSRSRRGDRDDLYDLFWTPAAAARPAPPAPARDASASARTARSTRPSTPDDVRERRRGLPGGGRRRASPSPSSTPTRTRSTSSPPSERCARSASTARSRSRTRSRASTASTSARRRPCRRVRAPAHGRLPAPRSRSGCATLGFDGSLLVTRSGGGAMTFAEAEERPFETIMSGPVAGAEGAAELARAARLRRRDHRRRRRHELRHVPDHRRPPAGALRGRGRRPAGADAVGRRALDRRRRRLDRLRRRRRPAPRRARAARAPIPARRATAAAAPSRPSPTRRSCSGMLGDGELAGGVRLDADAARGRAGAARASSSASTVEEVARGILTIADGEHGERDPRDHGRAGPRPAPRDADRLRRRGPAVRHAARATSSSIAADRRAAVRRQLLGLGPARRRPRRRPRRARASAALDGDGRREANALARRAVRRARARAARARPARRRARSALDMRYVGQEHTLTSPSRGRRRDRRRRRARSHERFAGEYERTFGHCDGRGGRDRLVRARRCARRCRARAAERRRSASPTAAPAPTVERVLVHARRLARLRDRRARALAPGRRSRARRSCSRRRRPRTWTPASSRASHETGSLFVTDGRRRDA